MAPVTPFQSFQGPGEAARLGDGPRWNHPQGIRTTQQAEGKAGFYLVLTYLLFEFGRPQDVIPGLAVIPFGTGISVLILLNVPLALIGGIIALWIFSIPLSVSAAIGFIALSGQAVLNGVVLLTVIEQLRSAGLNVLDAVKEGAMQRLRTVLMTAMLAALGLLPMALSHDIGAETQRPLAIVVIGGLFTATLLTLVVLPVLYVLWYKDNRTLNADEA